MRLPNWYRLEHDRLRFFRAWNLHASGLVEHGFSSRMGGIGSEPYNSLNLAFTVGDDPAVVLDNRRRFAEAITVDPLRIVVPNQVHSNTVKMVKLDDAGSGALDHSTAIPDTDALITNIPGVTLALHFADCVCVFLLDPENRAIGLVHAGWRGSALRIAAVAVEAMAREFGSDPSEMLAAISPAIGRCCYEVGEDAARELYKAYAGDERVLTQYSTNKWRADVRIANLISLKAAGLREDNIAVSEDCTSCDSENFFSYRRDGVTGRMGGWMSLR